MRTSAEAARRRVDEAIAHMRRIRNREVAGAVVAELVTRSFVRQAVAHTACRQAAKLS